MSRRFFPFAALCAFFFSLIMSSLCAMELPKVHTLKMNAHYQFQSSSARPGFPAGLHVANVTLLDPHAERNAATDIFINPGPHDVFVIEPTLKSVALVEVTFQGSNELFIPLHRSVICIAQDGSGIDFLLAFEKEVSNIASRARGLYPKICCSLTLYGDHQERLWITTAYSLFYASLMSGGGGEIRNENDSTQTLPEIGACDSCRKKHIVFDFYGKKLPCPAYSTMHASASGSPVAPSAEAGHAIPAAGAGVPASREHDREVPVSPAVAFSDDFEAQFKRGLRVSRGSGKSAQRTRSSGGGAAAGDAQGVTMSAQQNVAVSAAGSAAQGASSAVSSVKVIPTAHALEMNTMYYFTKNSLEEDIVGSLHVARKGSVESDQSDPCSVDTFLLEPQDIFLLKSESPFIVLIDVMFDGVIKRSGETIPTGRLLMCLDREHLRKEEFAHFREKVRQCFKEHMLRALSRWSIMVCCPSPSDYDSAEGVLCRRVAQQLVPEDFIKPENKVCYSGNKTRLIAFNFDRTSLFFPLHDKRKRGAEVRKPVRIFADDLFDTSEEGDASYVRRGQAELDSLKERRRASVDRDHVAKVTQIMPAIGFAAL